MGVITEIISDIFNIGKNLTIGPILQLLSDQKALDDLIFPALLSMDPEYKIQNKDLFKDDAIRELLQKVEPRSNMPITTGVYENLFDDKLVNKVTISSKFVKKNKFEKI
jgi:hypothetical protein